MSHTNNAEKFFSHISECVGNRATLLGCAEKLHSYTTHINPRARFPYNAICNADMKALIQSWKTPQDWPSHNKFISAEQDILFILLVNEATNSELA